LFFDNSQIPAQSEPFSSYFKMNPPLFGPKDKAALRKALRDGVLDFVATDHAPHEDEAKIAGWTLAPFGTRGMETCLPTLITLMEQGELSARRVEEIFALKARQLLPRALRKDPTGVIFVDPGESFCVELRDLPGKSNNSCFLGQNLRGRIFLRIQQDGSLYQIK
jgi:dihydroorotase